MEAERSYHKICTGSTTLNMLLQNLEENVCHVFMTGGGVYQVDSS